MEEDQRIVHVSSKDHSESMLYDSVEQINNKGAKDGANKGSTSEALSLVKGT